MKKLFSASVLLSLLFLLYPQTPAEVPQMINYQGKLTTGGGGCLNDTVQMIFSIYPDTLGSPADWTETQTSVIVKEGIFNVLLGSVNPIPASVFDGSTKYLGVKVESDPEMRPLKPMVSVAYAYRAGTAPADDDWVISGDDIYRLTGNVGISTTEPTARLEIAGGDNTDLIALPGGVKLTYRTEADSFYGFNLPVISPNSFFLHAEEPDYCQVLYFGDGRLDNNVFGMATKSPPSDWDVKFVVNQNGNVGIGTTNPQGALDVSSTTGAFIVPRMTTAERNTLTAVNGMIIYNATTNQFNFYENGAWVTK